MPLGVDPALPPAGRKRRLVVAEWRAGERLLGRAVARALGELPDWELVFLRTNRLSGRPPLPRALAGRVHVRTLRDGAARAELLREAAIFVPSPTGLPRALLEAKAAGAAIASPPGLAQQPELASAAVARLAEDRELRDRLGQEARRDAERESFAEVAAELDAVYEELVAKRRAPTSGSLGRSATG